MYESVSMVTGTGALFTAATAARAHDPAVMPAWVVVALGVFVFVCVASGIAHQWYVSVNAARANRPESVTPPSRRRHV